jgi:nucleoside-diphosphate-sugar epimerase
LGFFAALEGLVLSILKNFIEREDADYILDVIGENLLKLSGSTFLITGAAGFLGFNFLNCLVRWNEISVGSKVKIIACDNFFRGRPIWITRLEADGAIEVLEHDITKELPANLRCIDFIIHAASVASPIYYREFPIETMDANVIGLRRVLDYSVSSSLKGLLYFSTSEIYGDPPTDKIPTTEEYRGYVSCTGPRACYDESKRFGETLCVAFNKVHSVPVSVARPFNNYGPGLKLSDGRVIPDFCRDMLQGKDLVLLSDGSPTRTFCYVSDAIIGYMLILFKGRRGEAYNIGTETPELSMLALAQTISTQGKLLLGYKGSVKFGESRDISYLTDNPKRRCPDIGKAKRDLGYSPRMGLTEGISRSIKWYSENQ